MSSATSFTGRSRQRKTSWKVRAGEVLSRLFITVGGIGTIIAVFLVCIYLVIVVIPLFQSASLGKRTDLSVSLPVVSPLAFAVDEYEVVGWGLYPDGTLRVIRLDTGQLLEERPLFKGQELTALSTPDKQDGFAAGFKDGSIRLGKIGFTTEILQGDDIPSALRGLGWGEVAAHDRGVVERTSETQLRWQRVAADFSAPIEAIDSPVRCLDYIAQSGDIICGVAAADGKAYVCTITEKKSLISKKQTYELDKTQALPLPARAGRPLPSHLVLSSLGDNLYVIWADGQTMRFRTSDIDKPVLAETVNLIDQPGVTVTACRPLNGRTTLLVGDSSGRVSGWFQGNVPGARTGDGSTLLRAHVLTGPDAAVTALATSVRSRMMAAGYADGRARIFYVTNDHELVEGHAGSDAAVVQVALAPKDNGLVALTGSGLSRWPFDPKHPEVSLASLFRPVWYEGDSGPTHTWQSTSGNDSFEPKFGLWTLVFGTIKATIFALLIGVPLSLLSAVYTSEFLHPRAKTLVKPTIELMASLPSVVLGFLAALVVAPFVAKALSAILTALLTVPAAFLVGAYVWQLLPEKLVLRFANWRILLIVLSLPIGVLIAAWLGPAAETLLFQGDVKGWLNKSAGSATPGWFVLAFPLCALATAIFLGRVVNSRLRYLTRRWSRFHCALADGLKFLGATAVAIGLALAAAAVFASLGFDPRGTLVGRYDSRNALVVGLMMGFAIIPIIYTVAEDALSAVPESLRAASLGCGATPWQTAVRVIMPTAMSGMFSAIMIGLGRAVGETMIVLMAAGNTPILDWNVFNGFRTLSANIAVELPEAAVGSTHYRTLFLAALTLFCMTFLLNTVAEVIRQRFRKKAYQL